jgi:hypothetical protein
MRARRFTISAMRRESSRRMMAMRSRASPVISSKRVMAFPQRYIFPGLPGSFTRTPRRDNSSIRQTISSPKRGKMFRSLDRAAKSE